MPGATATSWFRRIRWTRWLGWVVAAAGVYVFVRLVREYDVGAVLAGLPPAFLLLIPLMGVRMVFGTLSWRFAFPNVERSSVPPTGGSR